MVVVDLAVAAVLLDSGCVVLFSVFGGASDIESASDAVTSLDLVAAMASHLSVVAADT